MAGRLEMPNGRAAAHGSKARWLEEDAEFTPRTGLVAKRETRRTQAAIGTGAVVLGAPRMRSVGPAIAAGREYANEAGDARTASRLDRAAGLRRQFLTGTTPFTPNFIRRRPGLSAAAGLALLVNARPRRN
jgi:hypothetical protein